jgi:hypothetical protein
MSSEALALEDGWVDDGEGSSSESDYRDDLMDEFSHVDYQYDEHLRYKHYRELVDEIDHKTRAQRESEDKRTHELIVEQLTQSEVDRQMRYRATELKVAEEKLAAAEEEDWVKMEAIARAQNRAIERTERKKINRAKRELMLAERLRDNFGVYNPNLEAKVDRAVEELKRSAANIKQVARNRQSVYASEYLPPSKKGKIKLQIAERERLRTEGVTRARRSLYNPTPNVNLDDPMQVRRGKASANHPKELFELGLRNDNEDRFLRDIDDLEVRFDLKQAVKEVRDKRKRKEKGVNMFDIPEAGDAEATLQQTGLGKGQSHRQPRPSVLRRSRSQAPQSFMTPTVQNIHSLGNSASLPSLLPDLDDLSTGRSSLISDSHQSTRQEEHRATMDKDYSSFNSPLNAPNLRKMRAKFARTNDAALYKNVSAGNMNLNEMLTEAADVRLQTLQALTPRSRKRRDMYRKQKVPSFAFQSWMKTRGNIVRQRITPNAKLHYRLMFDLLDANKNDTLEFSELDSALKAIGIKVTHGELQHIMSSFNKESLTFDEFVNGFASVSEWDRIFDVRRRRMKKGNSQAALPFTMWVPAYHRVQTMNDMMQLKHVKRSKSTGLSGLKEKSRQAMGKTLVDQWKYVQKQVASRNNALSVQSQGFQA